MRRLIELLFPPRLPGRICGWEERVEDHFDEQGRAGNVKPGPYRNGIERYFAEEASRKLFN